jgi:sugar phosphate isomerase/epimerase
MSTRPAWPIGLSTGIYYAEPLLAVLPRLSEFGLPLLEVCSFPAHFDYHDRALARRVRRAIDGYGLAVHSLHAPFSHQVDITLLDEEARRHAVGEVKAAAAALAELGGRVLVIHPGGEIGPDAGRVMERLDRSADSLAELQAHCTRLGLTLAIEDMLPHLLAGETGDLLWLARRLPAAHAGFCLDTGHAFLARELIQRVELFGPRLVLLHLNDNHGAYDDHLPPGEGAIDWPAVIAGLRQAAYAGVLMLEVAGRADDAALWHGVRRSAAYLGSLMLATPDAAR